MLDGEQNIMVKYSSMQPYDAFGVGETTEHSPIGYAGQYHDEETGLIYLRARYYNPETGRFINEDPIRDGLNWYVYCSNNPVRFVDPSGLVVTEWDIEHLSSEELKELNTVTIEYLVAKAKGDQIGMNLAHDKAVELREPYLNQFEQVGLDGTISEITADTSIALTVVLLPLTALTGCTAKDYNDWISNNTAWKSGALTTAAPQYLLIDDLQLGQKFGKHIYDYPGMASHFEYRVLAYDVFNNPDYITYDQECDEYYYINGDDLLRVKPNGSFVSLYPGANSPRINNSK